MAELHAQDRGLDFVQTAVPAGLITYIFSSLTVIAQGAQTCFEFFGIGYDYARVAGYAEILSWIEADARTIAGRARSPAFVRCAAGLAAASANQRTLYPRKPGARFHL